VRYAASDPKQVAMLTAVLRRVRDGAPPGQDPVKIRKNR